jgi:anti-sigma factor RsiW
MTCRQLVDVTIDYVAGELPADARAEVEAHRADCPECAAYLETYAATIALEKAAYRGDDPSLPKAAIDAILTARKKKG